MSTQSPQEVAEHNRSERRRGSRKADADPSCVDCHCTHNQACVGFDGMPCHWVSMDPPVCSTCADKRDMKAAAGQLRSRARLYRDQNSDGRGRWKTDRTEQKAAYRECLRLAHRLEEITGKAGR